jgi:Abnormal spindle-like microcephaly-assoc'd, ASPM-SPD-2-Hydin/Beta-propeller repeat
VNTRVSGAASLVYSTYVGGSGLDQGNGIAIDSAGNAYIAGTTASSSFVFTPNGFQTTNHGQGDAFVAKLTSAGALSYFTFLGGSLADSGVGVAVDTSGNAHVTGSTVSSSDFPITTPVFQRLYGGGNADAFVAKLNPTGSVLLYSSYLGGTNTELAGGIAVDAAGSAYVTGQTCSQDFPLANPLQASSAGNCDAYVSKVSVLGGLAISPAGLVFPAQSLGTTGGPLVVTLTNANDSASVTISSIAMSGTNPGDFVQTNTCPGTLAAGAQCNIAVTFHPSAVGIRKAAVTVNASTNGSATSYVISLNGSTSTVLLSTSSLSFGTQQVSATSAAQTVTVTNSGTVALNIASITASGDFAETNNCSVALQPMGTCVISVTFKPLAAGASTGAVTLNDNGSGSPQIILLGGTGVGLNADFTIAAVSPSATISAGQSATYNLTLTPFGGFSQPVALTCNGLPAGATCSISPNPATPSTGSTVKVNISTALRAKVTPASRDFYPTASHVHVWGRQLTLSLFIFLSAIILMRLRRRPGTVVFGSAVALLLLCAACSGGTQAGQPTGTPAGAYQVNIVGTAGSISHTTAVMLQVN